MLILYQRSVKNSYYEKIGEKVICIDDELPFDVPASWSWTRFGNIVLNYDSQRRPITKHNRVNDLGLYDYYGATGAIDKVDSYIFDGEYLMIGDLTTIFGINVFIVGTTLNVFVVYSGISVVPS